MCAVFVVCCTIFFTEVDFPGFAIKGFPTIFFFPAGDAKKAVEYDGGRDLDGFLAFLGKKATQGAQLGGAAAAAGDDEEDDEGSEEEL